MSRTLYVDLDSTLWDTEPLYVEAQEIIYGHVVPYEAKTDWDIYRTILGDNFHSIFDYALHPDHIHRREFYEGALSYLTEIVWEHEFHVHFLSHNPKPDLMLKPIAKWLGESVPFPHTVQIVTAENCKIEIMEEDDTAWGIVEDKPSTLTKAAERGYNTYAHLHPWNLATVKESTAIRGFVHWSDLLVMITHDARLASAR